jgi:hypothetical protein
MTFTSKGELLVVGYATGGLSIEGQFLQGKGAADAFIAKFKAEGLPPSFVTYPKSQALSAGVSVVLSADVTDNGSPATYQWWFNGSALKNETHPTLAINNAGPAQAGGYYLVAKNEFGEARSNPATISYTDASTLILSIHPSLTIYGTPGKTYKIEYATEALAPPQWKIATTLTLSTTPQLWIDPDAAVGEHRFYRVLLETP